MYTQCPECKKQRTITAKELRSTRGIIDCAECSSKFDALELLNEGSITNKKAYETLPDLEISIKKRTIPWNLGFSLCLIGFVFQIVFFETYTLTQNTTLRPWLEKACSYFDCKLPVYKNLREFTLLHASFEPAKNEHYVFKTTFVNQSDFEQKYPSIKLTLQNYTGQDFAQRVFYPHEYASKNLSLLKPEISAEITLDIVKPTSKIAGYQFELI